MDAEIKPEASLPSEPQVRSSEWICRIKRTLLLMLAMIIVGGAFDIGDTHPMQAVLLAWHALPILLYRECLLRHIGDIRHGGPDE